jgi:hypothetical protein
MQVENINFSQLMTEKKKEEELKQMENKRLAKEFYDSCWLVTPYSSKLFQPNELHGLDNFTKYSFQAASLAARLASTIWGNYNPKTVWFGRDSKISVTTQHDSNVNAISMTDEELDEYILHTITNDEYNSSGMRAESYPTIHLVRALIIDDNWKQLSYQDQTRLLGVYGLLVDYEEEDEDLYTHPYEVKFNMLKNLQSVCARELESWYDDSFESRGYNPIGDLLHDVY